MASYRVLARREERRMRQAEAEDRVRRAEARLAKARTEVQKAKARRDIYLAKAEAQRFRPRRTRRRNETFTDMLAGLVPF